MAEGVDKNPIELRLDYLSGMWNAFAKDSDARLLRWLVDDDGRRMVELLIEWQNTEAGDLPDLFVRFSTPFENPVHYPVQLLSALREQYEESREDLTQAGLSTGWQCPAQQSKESALDVFVRAACSFREHYQGKMLALALVLTPEHVADEKAWQNVLLALVRANLPSAVRVTVIDHIERPALTMLAEAEPKRVRTVTPELDMPDALEEIAGSAGGVGPGYDFRQLFVRLGNAASRGDVGAAHRLAVAALRITRKHKWPDLQVPVFMVLGALHLQLGDRDKALLAYQRAGRSAQAAKAAANPAGGKLMVQTGFAEAAALLAAERHAEAAPLYEGLVLVAKEETEPFLEFEAWRMASYCHEMTGAPREAWCCGLAALDAAAALDPELRRNSTLPFLGQRLIDLVRRYRGEAKHVRELRTRLQALIGADWEQTLRSTAGKDAVA